MRPRKRAERWASPQQPTSPYGLLAEFEQGEALLAAAHQAFAAGYRQDERLHAFPARRLVEALGQKPTRLPLLTLARRDCRRLRSLFHALLRLGD